MFDVPRLLLRLRRRVLQCYDLLLYAMLIGLLAGALVPASSQEARDDPVHCGNIQGSAVIITR